MESLDDTWTLSDLSSSIGGSIVHNSITSTDVNNVNKKEQKPIYSPISSMDSQSDNDELQKPIKPFLKRTSVGYKAANPIQNVVNHNFPVPTVIDHSPNLIPLPSKPEVKFDQEQDPIKSTDSTVPTIGPDLYSLSKSGVHNLALSHNLRGYEIAPPKVTTHMDFVEYMKFHSKKREFEMVTDIPKTKKIEEKKECIVIRESKIPEALYTYIARTSPQKKEGVVSQKKESRVLKFPKLENMQKKENVSETRISGRNFENIEQKKIETESQSKKLSWNEEGLERVVDSKTIEKNIEKISSFRNEIENAVKESEQKLCSFQQLLERILKEKEKEYDNILSKTATQVSSTINNSMNRMGLDLKGFYKQFDKLQKVTSDITSKFGRQLSEDQKRSQVLLSKQMKQIEDLGKKLEIIEKKTNQLRENSGKAISGASSRAKNNTQTKKFFELISKPTELTIEEIHNEVSKKHPSIFKYPNWDVISPLGNLELYQNEQKCLIDELVGKSIDSIKKLHNMDFGSFVIEEPKFFIEIDKKIKIDNTPPRPLVISKTELSSNEISKKYPEFSNNLLKFSIMHKRKPHKSPQLLPSGIINEQNENLLVLKMESQSVQTDVRTQNTSIREMEIQTESPFEGTLESENPTCESLEEIEKCNIGWTKKDNSAMCFQNGIDTRVEKELSRYEKERLIRAMIPKKDVQIPKLNECEDFDGICYTSHYTNRSIKTDERTQKNRTTRTEGGKDLNLIFEEYANCLIERAINHISTNVIGEYLSNVLYKENGLENDCSYSNDEKFKTIKGGALCAELFSFCFKHDVPFDDKLIYNVTEDLLTDFIKSKLPQFGWHDAVTEIGVGDFNEYDLERVSELVLRLLLLDRLGIWDKVERDECKEREFVSHKINNSQGKEVDSKQRLTPSLTTIVSKEKSISFEAIQTEVENISPTTPLDTQSRLGLPHSTFFILSDNLTECLLPISVSTKPNSQQCSIYTQTVLNDPPRMESISVQTTDLSKSISAIQTEETPTRSTTTETNSKNLFVQYNPSSFFNVVPQIATPKETQSREMQTSFSTKTECVTGSFSTSTDVTSESTNTSSSVLLNENIKESFYQLPDSESTLQKEKLFATLTENEIEKMLKIQMLKRSVIQKETYSPESESEDSFLSSEQSVSAFYTSDSSNGFSYTNKRYESDDCFNSSSSDTCPFIGTRFSTETSNTTFTSFSDSNNYSTLGQYLLGDQSPKE